MIASKKTKSAASIARSGQLDASVSAARGHEEQYGRIYFANTYATFKGSTQIGLCFDESTISAESTLTTAIFARDKPVHAWLLPQAFFAHSGG